MVETTYLHIGLPKTGTTYLQQILWENRGLLGKQGVVLPGRSRREHLWAALECMGADMKDRPARAVGSLGRICEAVAADRHRAAVISHEFFCGASAEQAAAMIERLEPSRVELIVTARDAAGMLTSGWQELLKNGGSLTLEQAWRRESGSEFSWQTWDLHDVLTRWAPTLPADQVHILPMPQAGAPADQHWRNFADVMGLEGDFVLPEGRVNASLGAVQTELLRRVTPLLGEFKKAAVDRGEWIRGYLAEERLSAQQGERIGLPAEIADDCDRRSARAVDLVRSAGYRVTGGPEALLPSGSVRERRDPSTVTDAELVRAASELVAAMLTDVRSAREQGPMSPDVARQAGSDRPRRPFGRRRT